MPPPPLAVASSTYVDATGHSLGRDVDSDVESTIERPRRPARVPDPDLVPVTVPAQAYRADVRNSIANRYRRTGIRTMN